MFGQMNSFSKKFYEVLKAFTWRKVKKWDMGYTRFTNNLYSTTYSKPLRINL